LLNCFVGWLLYPVGKLIDLFFCLLLPSLVDWLVFSMLVSLVYWFFVLGAAVLTLYLAGSQYGWLVNRLIG